MDQNFLHTAKATLRGKFIALDEHFRKIKIEKLMN